MAPVDDRNMRKINAALVFVLLQLIAATGHAQGFDLTAFARITATDTRNTFFFLWPRETDDAPYTIRDGDPATSWKIPDIGQSKLTLDFMPFARKPPQLRSIEAEWGALPQGTVVIRTSPFCGSSDSFDKPWPDVTQRLVFDSAVEAGCLELTFNDPKKADLVELHVYSATGGNVPSIGDLQLTELENAIRLTWTAGENVHHVRVLYGLNIPAADWEDVLIDITPANDSWEGPRPLENDMMAILIPETGDGQTGELKYINVPARESATLPSSGIVEGFYGRPWSHAERRKMMLLLGRIGLGLYIYGPKNDPLHRDEWRTPYGEEEIAKFVELLELGRMVGVTYSFGISPGKDMEMEDEGEKQTLLDKLTPLVEGGFRHFTLLLDDIENDLDEPVDGALGAKHAALADWLLDALEVVAGEDIKLFIVPTVYSTQRQNAWPGGSDYLDAMAALDSEIELMWTGTDTFSPTLEAADLADVTARTGRAPAIWDNEHATDGGDAFHGKVYLAPYENRSADLVGAVRGVVTNPMILGAADRLMLGTYADYLLDPAGYDANASLQRAARLEWGSELDRDLALKLVQTHYGSGVHGIPGVNLPRNPRMDEAVADFQQALRGGDRGQIIANGASLLRVAADMATTQDQMHHSGLDPSLVDDMQFPCMRLTHEGRNLLRLLDWAAAKMAGEDCENCLDDSRFWFGAALHDRYQLSLGRVALFSGFLQNNAPDDIGFQAPDIAEPMANPMPGEKWIYDVSTEADVSVYGLAGSQVIDGQIHWTPPHSGTYKAVVVAENGDGWSYLLLNLVVGEDEVDFDDDDTDDEDVNDDMRDDDVSSDSDDDDDGACCG